jgi:hypothetical protein
MAGTRFTNKGLAKYASKAALAGDWGFYGCQATSADPILGPSVTVGCLEPAGMSLDGTPNGARCQVHA